MTDDGPEFQDLRDSGVWRLWSPIYRLRERCDAAYGARTDHDRVEVARADFHAVALRGCAPNGIPARRSRAGFALASAGGIRGFVDS